MTAAPLLALEEIACIRGGRLLFEGLSLKVVAGAAAVVVGPNGVGKSSLLRIAAGLLPASAGSVERGGGMALADERLALDERLTLKDALGFWWEFDKAKPESGMEAMGLASISQVPVRMLSTGQRKRAVLARVIASGAPLWLLDEPANGLDTEGQRRLAQAIEEHRRRGGAILAATHQPLRLEGAEEVRLVPA